MYTYNYRIKKAKIDEHNELINKSVGWLHIVLSDNIVDICDWICREIIAIQLYVQL